MKMPKVPFWENFSSSSSFPSSSSTISPSQYDAIFDDKKNVASISFVYKCVFSSFREHTHLEENDVWVAS